MKKNNNIPALHRTKFQRGEERWITRTQIHEAHYNPRVIGEGAAKRLRDKIKSSGLLGTLIWNERTGNLVSGHQRLKQIDSLEGYPKRVQDYEIRVTAVDLSEREEMEMNVFLNNPSDQGEWNLDALASLNTDHGIDFSAMGFTEADVDFLFDGDSRFSALYQDTEEVKEAKEKLREIKQDRSAMTERLRVEQSADFYFTVVCQSQTAKDDLLKAIGVPLGEEFVNGALVALRLGVPVDA